MPDTEQPPRRRSRRPPRAEHVGSLLRPPRLVEVIRQVYDPTHTSLLDDDRERDLPQLRAVENELIPDVVRRQIECGLDVVTDGEFRRILFVNSFYDAIAGLGPSQHEVVFRSDSDEVHAHVGPSVFQRRLEKVDSPCAREARFLASITDHPFKVTFPAGSWWVAPHVIPPGVSPPGYGSREEAVQHALDIERQLIREAIDSGAEYIQLDYPCYGYLIDERARNQRLPSLGVDPGQLFDDAIAADRRIIEDMPGHVHFGMHLCRGNHRSRWMFEGSLEPVAERLFTELPYDSFLIEWEDTRREGDYSPLRHVPRGGPTVVMGIISSKHAALESEDEVLRHMDEANRFLDLEQLGLSPQCGFASTVEGNELAEDAQWRKLELVGRVADRLWPDR